MAMLYFKKMKIYIYVMFLIFAFSSCRQPAGHLSEFHWRSYSKQAVEDSVARKKPVVIDFFADWCPNCHDLDREVFSLPEIQDQLAKTTALRMDVTDQDDPQVQKILQEYEIEGVPTVVFLDTRGHEIKESRVIGFVSPQEFYRALALLKIFK
jgi:thioredoxin:protein disulfide reductase